MESLSRFRFRAWAEASQRMICPHKLTPLALDPSMEGGLKGVFLPFDDGYIIMQSTGLKDKNGKLIFEGDIVRCVCNMANIHTGELTGAISTKIYSIEWGGLKPQFCYRDHSNKNRLEAWCLFNDSCEKYYEIIGNIHENPELLEKE